MRSSQSGASQHTAQANACQFQDCATRQGARQATHLIAKNGGWASWESGDDPFLLGFSLFQESEIGASSNTGSTEMLGASDVKWIPYGISANQGTCEIPPVKGQLVPE